MKQVGIRALKQNASAVVADASTGESVVITDRGRAVAQLVPLPQGRLAQLVASGRARAPKRSLGALGDPARRTRDEVPLSTVLEETRRDERY